MDFDEMNLNIDISKMLQIFRMYFTHPLTCDFCAKTGQNGTNLHIKELSGYSNFLVLKACNCIFKGIQKRLPIHV